MLCWNCKHFDKNDAIHCFGTCEIMDEDFHATHDCSCPPEDIRSVESMQKERDGNANNRRPEFKHRVDFKIVSIPYEIKLECPYCGDDDIRLPWQDVRAPKSLSDAWPDVKCPNCGHSIKLGEWDYD